VRFCVFQRSLPTTRRRKFPFRSFIFHTFILIDIHEILHFWFILFYQPKRTRWSQIHQTTSFLAQHLTIISPQLYLWQLEPIALRAEEPHPTLLQCTVLVCEWQHVQFVVLVVELGCTFIFIQFRVIPAFVFVHPDLDFVLYKSDYYPQVYIQIQGWHRFSQKYGLFDRSITGDHHFLFDEIKSDFVVVELVCLSYKSTYNGT